MKQLLANRKARLARTSRYNEVTPVRKFYFCRFIVCERVLPRPSLEAAHVIQPVPSVPHSPPRLKLVAKSLVDRGFVGVGRFFGMDSVRDLRRHCRIGVHRIWIAVWSASHSSDGLENV